MGSKKFTPTNQRLLDLLRYARQELYMANLLSNEEYFEIATDYPAVERLESYDAARKRIRELEAELAVRDNSANEVLRILREATGKRDFHSEMEAAEWVAKMLAEAVEAGREAVELARLDSARLDYLQRRGCVTIEADVQDRFGIDLDSDEYPKHKDLRAAIDAAIKEAK